jgi:hypothetical protein
VATTVATAEAVAAVPAEEARSEAVRGRVGNPHPISRFMYESFWVVDKKKRGNVGEFLLHYILSSSMNLL